jgi:putative hemolysin
MTLEACPIPARRAPHHRTALEHELTRLPRSRLLVEQGPYAVHVSPAVAIPNVLRELAHRRAEAFPEAFAPGEVDLDRFDTRYLHLFVWNRAESELVGGYRLGCTDLLGARERPERLYTHGLFDFDRRFVRALDPAIELGRSFVCPKYRRSFAALHLLWRGIGSFVARQRRYRHLFGALTLPQELGHEARACCLRFLKAHRAPEELARLVRGRVPLAGWSESRGRIPAARSLDELEQQLARLGAGGVPPLLRHYSRLGARTCDFSIDPAFGGSVDAFLVVDLASAPRALTERYLGPVAARSLQNRNAYPRMTVES